MGPYIIERNGAEICPNFTPYLSQIYPISKQL